MSKSSKHNQTALVPPPARPRRRRKMGKALAQAGLLIAITLAAYFPTFWNGYIWDDTRYVETNEPLTLPGGLTTIWTVWNSEPQYYPMTHTTFWLECQMWEKKPLGYHIDNMALQMASAILLWRLLVRLKVPGALVAAAIFAVHPVQVETVAWVTERKNLLSGFFYFLSLWSYLHTPWGRRIWQTDDASLPKKMRDPGAGTRASAVEAREGTGTLLAQGGWYVGSYLLFCLSLLAKSVTATLPAVILLLAYWKRGRIRWIDVLLMIPFVTAGAAMGSFTSWMEVNYVGAIGPDFDWMTWLDRIAIAGRAVWFYLCKLIVPYKLIFIYPRWHVDPHHEPWQLIFPAAAALAIAALWMLRLRLGRGPLVAALFFVGTLFPALGFRNVFPMQYSYVADHFQYLAMMGPVILAVAFISRRVKRQTGAIIATVLVAVYCGLSAQECRAYKDRTTLFTNVIDKNPDCPMAYNNRGGEYFAAKEYDKALADFDKAWHLQYKYADWAGIGRVYRQMQPPDYQKALYYFQKQLDTHPVIGVPLMDAMRCIPYFEIAYTYQMMAHDSGEDAKAAHDYRLKAIEFYRKSIKQDPEYVPSMDNLAAALQDEGRVDEAIQVCENAISYDPWDLRAHTLLGNAYQTQNRLKAAENEYAMVLYVEPKNVFALVNLGSVYGKQGNYSDAMDCFQQALAIDPNNLKAELNVGTVCLFRGDYDQAISYSRAVLAAEPGNHMAKHNLAVAMAMKARQSGQPMGNP